MIEVQGISKTFGKGDTAFVALDDISFSVPDGATLAIIGKSGSGKSTLMHIMSGLDHPTSGSVVFDGKSITSMKPKQADAFRATEMSFIFQSFFIEANRTCLDNVMLPMEISKTPHGNRVAKAKAALQAVELSEKISVKAKNLSGGQKQRLAIARSIINQPKLLFADEPTGNLDSATGDKITDMLFDLNKKLNSTLVIVTHDDDLAAQCEYQLRLKDGKIEAFKTPSKKLAKKGAK